MKHNKPKFVSKNTEIEEADFNELALLDNLINKDSNTLTNTKSMTTWLPISDFEVGMSGLCVERRGVTRTYAIKDSPRNRKRNVSIEEFLNDYCSG